MLLLLHREAKLEVGEIIGETSKTPQRTIFQHSFLLTVMELPYAKWFDTHTAENTELDVVRMCVPATARLWNLEQDAHPRSCLPMPQFPHLRGRRALGTLWLGGRGVKTSRLRRLQQEPHHRCASASCTRNSANIGMWVINIAQLIC